MKFSDWVSFSLLILSSIGIAVASGSADETLVYHFNQDTAKGDVSQVSNNETIAYLCDRLGVSSLLQLGDFVNKNDVIKFLGEHNKNTNMNLNSRPLLVMTVEGKDEKLLTRKPSFTVKDSDMSLLTDNLPLKLAKKSRELIASSHFSDSDNKIDKLADLVKGQSNDIFNFESLENNRQVYIYSSKAEKVSEEKLNDMSESMEIIVIETHPDVSSNNKESQVKQFSNSFSKRDKKGSASSCFDSEENCQVGTSNCNSHGVCSKIKSKCWACVCSPSVNETTSQTTNWSGFDCGKRDISSTANLLLWSSLTILIMIVGGIKLLYSIGNEPLPGVLDAASTMKS